MSERKRRKNSHTSIQGKYQEHQSQLQVNNLPITGVGEVTPAYNSEVTVGHMLAEKEFTGNISGATIEILPAEMLQLIYKNIESAKDLLSCWNTSATLKSILRSTDFLFKMILPFVVVHLDWKDLLNCSAVSKNWNATVDVFIQDAEEFGSDHRLNRPQQHVFYMDSDVGSPKIRKTLRKSANKKAGKKIVAANPVAFRHAEVWFEFNEKLDPRLVVNSMLQCLQYYGHLIRHLHLRILDKENVTLIHKIELIKRCLQRTPNMRVLHIYAYPLGRYLDREMKLFKIPNLHTTWPSLEHLKVLKFHELTCEEIYASVAKTYASQILQIQFSYEFMKFLQPITGQFSCLQKIVFLYSNVDSTGGWEFNDFVRSVPSPLKHIAIEFWVNPEYDYTCKGLTKAINAAGATLEILEFRRPRQTQLLNRYNFDITNFSRLRLPRLKVLDLCGFGYPLPTFLHSVCPALQQLTVTPYSSRRKGYQKMVIAGKIYSDLYSNLRFWTRLADIRSVDVKNMFEYVRNKNDDLFGEEVKKTLPWGELGKVYTRQGYEASLEKNLATRSDNYK